MSVRDWALAYPRLFEAQVALTEALEDAGELEGPAAEMSALDVVRNARSLARGNEDLLTAAVSEVRILTKLGRFSDSEALARATLGTFPDPEPTQAMHLAPLAALTGRNDTRPGDDQWHLDRLLIKDVFPP